MKNQKTPPFILILMWGLGLFLVFGAVWIGLGVVEPHLAQAQEASMPTQEITRKSGIGPNDFGIFTKGSYFRLVDPHRGIICYGVNRKEHMSRQGTYSGGHVPSVAVSTSAAIDCVKYR